MGRIALFYSPLMLGFEHFERTLDNANRAAADGYPPYNIEKVAGDTLRISLAVAGFTRDDLSIVLEDNQLVIKGRQSKDEDRIYVHRGIAARQFQRVFVLADGIEVQGAELENGLLHVDLIRPKPTIVARSIKIKSVDDLRDKSTDSDVAVKISDETVSSKSISDEAMD